MKELSIEEKAKRYDEAYKVAKNIHIFSSDLAEIKRMEEIFPELKEESADERIRKALINGFNKLDKSAVWYNGITNGQILAWLEKQNEQKPVIEMKTPEESLGIDSDTYNKIVDECVYELVGQKPADEVKPKFKVGDYIEPIDSCLGSPRTIYKICDGWYETNQGTLNFEYENNWRLIEQKPAWSEEDELMLVSIIQTLKLTNGAAQMKIDWLKSLKERILPKSTWNEEDESMLNFVKVVLNKHKNDAFFDKFETTLNDCLTWFRNIKSRVGCEVNCTTTWKPSDEQIEILDMVLTNASMDDNIARILRELREQLKKLKE